MTPTVFLAWQNPRTSQWFPIGRLRRLAEEYEFEYVGGARSASEIAEFALPVGFPELDVRYVSAVLFPLFSNRLMPPSRPDYIKYLDYFGLTASVGNEMSVLGRSGGFRRTDTFELFPYPEGHPGGEYQMWFFVHRLNLMPESALDRIDRLNKGERLRVLLDFQNPADDSALALRTGDEYDCDIHIVGYLPRYLRADVGRMMKLGNSQPTVTVERVNPLPAPPHLRVLCRLRMPWPIGFEPFSGPEYQPIAALQPA